MTADLDALEALAKAEIINDDPEDWPLEGAVGWDRPEDNKLVAALTPGTVLALIAELRQERERASDLEGAYNSAVERHRLAAEKRDEYQQLYGDMADDERRARAALSRAEKTIEAVREAIEHTMHPEQDEKRCGVCRIERLLTEYGKQKEGDRG